MAIEKKNAWEKYPQGPEREKLFAFAEDYRRFISGCKTERECTAAVYADATGHGFVDLDELIETPRHGGNGLRIGNAPVYLRSYPLYADWKSHRYTHG